MFKNRKLRKLDDQIIEKRILRKKYEELRDASKDPEINRSTGERYLNELIEKLNKEIDDLTEERYRLIA